MFKKSYRLHVFIPKLRLWIKDEDLNLFLQDPEAWQKYYHPETGVYSNSNITPLEIKQKENETQERKETNIDDSFDLGEYSESFRLSMSDFEKIHQLTYEDLLILLLKEDILIEYISTRQQTANHEKDITRIFRSRFNEGKELFPTDERLPAFRQDSFTYDRNIRRKRRH